MTDREKLTKPYFAITDLNRMIDGWCEDAARAVPCAHEFPSTFRASDDLCCRKCGQRKCVACLGKGTIFNSPCHKCGGVGTVQPADCTNQECSECGGNRIVPVPYSVGWTRCPTCKGEGVL